MDFIFTGTPTKREIMIYLRNRKYSLLNYPRLKREIILKNKGKSKIDLKCKKNIKFRNRNSKLRQDYRKLVKEKVFYRAMEFKWNTDILFNISYRDLSSLKYVINYETKENFDNKKEEQHKLMIESNELNNELMIEGNEINNELNNELMIEGNEIKIEGNEIKNESNEIKIESNEIKIESNGLNIEDNGLNIEGNELKIESNEIKNESNTTQNKTIDFNIEQGDFNIEKSDSFCEMHESSILQNKLSFFDEISDEGNQKKRNLDISKIVSPTKSKDSRLFDKNVLTGSLFSFGNSSLSSQRKDNLKLITESSQNNVKQKILDLKNIKIDDKKQVDFTFTKVTKKPLQEINSNINKTKKNVDNYEKVLVKNTKLNSGYKNIIIRYTDKLITNHIKTGKNRNQKVKFADIENDIDIHNPASPLPIIKKSKFHNKSLGKNKHKEVVFIQNVDLSSFNLEDDF